MENLGLVFELRVIHTPLFSLWKIPLLISAGYRVYTQTIHRVWISLLVIGLSLPQVIHTYPQVLWISVDNFYPSGSHAPAATENRLQSLRERSDPT